jgi:AcrR family transcriptional regulator
VEEPPTRSEIPLWARPGRDRRPALTRQSVVAAAMRIADADGLAAVSIRRVAAELGARTMSLYSHIDSKDDLLDLMREQVAAETFVEGELPADWREAIRLIARRARDTGLRHPWMIHLIGHAGQVGPNALRHLEQALRALSGLTNDPIAALAICVAVDEYVLGHVIGAVTRRPTGSFTQPYTRMLLDSGAFPTLVPLITGGLPRLGDTFEHGLTCLLTGIEATHRR